MTGTTIENIYRKYQYYLLGFLSFVLILTILFLGSEIGLSDNGDFKRVMSASSLSFETMDKSFVYIPSYIINLPGNGFLRDTFHILFDKSGYITYPSIQVAFVRISVIINLLINRLTGAATSLYRLKVLGIMYSLCYAAVLSYLFAQIRLSKWWVDLIGKLIIIIVLCDVGYVTYFNSFYGEALQIISFVLIAGVAIRIMTWMLHKVENIAADSRLDSSISTTDYQSSGLEDQSLMNSGISTTDYHVTDLAPKSAVGSETRSGKGDVIFKKSSLATDSLIIAFSCLVYGWTKFANIPAAIFLCLGLEAILWYHSRKKWPIAASAFVLVILIAVYSSIPSWMSYDTTYNAIFYGALMDTDTVTAAEYLKELGLDTEMVELSGTNAYTVSVPDIVTSDTAPSNTITSNTAASDTAASNTAASNTAVSDTTASDTAVSHTVSKNSYLDNIARVSKLQLLSLYLRHPCLFWKAIRQSFHHSGMIRPYYLSNYDSSYSRFTLSSRFSLWNTIRGFWGFDTTAGNIAVLIAFSIMLIILLWNKAVVPCMIFLSAFWLFSFYTLATPFISNGYGDLAKHMLAFEQIIDAGFIAVLITAIGSRSKKDSKESAMGQFKKNGLSMNKRITLNVITTVLLTVLILPYLSNTFVNFIHKMDNHTSLEPGAYIEIGSYCGQPLLWQVLSAENGSAQLLCTEAIMLSQFSYSNENYWSISSLRKWLNTSFLSCFTDQELESLINAAHPIILSNSHKHLATSGNRDFFCSHLAEVSAINHSQAYQYTEYDLVSLPGIEDIASLAAVGRSISLNTRYWLDTPYYNNSNMVRCVYPDGKIYFRDAKEAAGVRPVIFIDTHTALSGYGSLRSCFRLR